MTELWGVLLGGALTLAGGFGGKIFDEWRQRSALRAAFGAEIAGLLKIAKMRRHDEAAKRWIVKWKCGEDYHPKMFGVPDDNEPVYNKNADKIGILGSVASDVVLFYTLLKAIRVHLRAIQEGRTKELTIEQRIIFVEQALSLWQQTLPLAENLEKRLSR
jgi:hypothetical protein